MAYDAMLSGIHVHAEVHQVHDDRTIWT